MAILRKAVCSVVAPMMAMAIMLPTAQADSITENSTTSVTKTEQDYLSTRGRDVASRAAIRLAFGVKITNTAKKYVGKPYCRGGIGPRCFDCSGFTRYVYAKNGIPLSHVASQQLRGMKRIKRSQAKPGDLVFFVGKGGRIYHVGIYAGGNKILHSPRPGRKVKYEKIWSSHVIFATIK